MLRKGFIAFVFAATLAVNVFAADVVVRIAPPAPVVEHRIAAPGAGYVWTPGAWVMPPRPHAHWVAHRWVRRNGGYVFVEGRWR